MHDITTGTLTGQNWFYLYSCTVYGDQNLKTEVRPEVRMVPPPTWKVGTDFPCHKMTALEIQSIVASCKYSI